jgi:hypothetical protein
MRSFDTSMDVDEEAASESEPSQESGASEESEGEEEEEDEEGDEAGEKAITNSKNGEKNSQLAVGYKHDRSFVSRGSSIGVFKHSGGQKLDFVTTIKSVKAPGDNGKLFSPKKVTIYAVWMKQAAMNASSSFY